MGSPAGSSPLASVWDGLGTLRRLLCRGTLFSSIFTLLTTCIGAGTLALPFAIKQGGLVYASVVFFLIMVISVAVGLYLIESKRYSKKLFPNVEIGGYEDLAEVAFGAVGRVSLSEQNFTISQYDTCIVKEETPREYIVCVQGGIALLRELRN